MAQAEKTTKKTPNTTPWSEIKAGLPNTPTFNAAYESARVAYEIGKSIREHREAKGLSQAELAKLARMSQPAIARFEAGGTVPTLPVLLRLAAALGLQLKIGVEAPKPIRKPRLTCKPTEPIPARMPTQGELGIRKAPIRKSGGIAKALASASERVSR